MKTADLKPVEFSCHAPDAQAVFLAGSFNNWSPDTLPLARQAEGHWHAVVPLPSGRYEFKFVVDGNWCCGPGLDDQAECPGCCGNDQGTMNRFIEV